jgi:dipeptidyl aminopeptidase/acylaminoacyl peptidase
MKAKVLTVLSILSLGLMPFLNVGIANATAPLTNSQISYTYQNQDIKLVNSDGTGGSTLVNHTSIPYATYPQISPDRTKVYFVGGNSQHVYSINSDGTGATDLGYVASQIALSPDGTKLATIYANHYVGGTYYKDVRIMNVDGTGATDIYPSIAGDMSSVAWSRDGNSVVFQWYDRSGVGGTCNYWISKMNTNGTGFTNLSPDNTSQSYNSCAAPNNPAVDPVTGKIAYSLGSASIQVMNYDGSSNSQLYATSGSGIVEYPTWSPDGTQIAIYYRQPTTNNPYVASLDASSGSLTTVTSITYGTSVTWMDWASISR